MSGEPGSRSSDRVGERIGMNRQAALAIVFVCSLAGLAGCPQVPPAEFVAGSTGTNATLGATSSVTVASPNANLSIAGGTPVEVNFRVTATTNFASIDIVFDPDRDPTNGNEIVAQTG